MPASVASGPFRRSHSCRLRRRHPVGTESVLAQRTRVHGEAAASLDWLSGGRLISGRIGGCVRSSNRCRCHGPAARSGRRVRRSDEAPLDRRTSSHDGEFYTLKRRASTEATQQPHRHHLWWRVRGRAKARRDNRRWLVRLRPRPESAGTADGARSAAGEKGRSRKDIACLSALPQPRHPGDVGAVRGTRRRRIVLTAGARTAENMSASSKNRGELFPPPSSCEGGTV